MRAESAAVTPSNTTRELTVEPPSTSTVITDPQQRRKILLAANLALMAVVASVSGLNVAQPQLATSFDASQSQVLWIINVYTLTLAALLLPLGSLGDRWGRRPALLTGLVIFGFANAIAAIAPTFEVMLGARMLSGVGAALIMPVTLSVITSSFPDNERAKAIGIWSAVAGGGGLLGMYLSALLVDVATWRWLFALPIVLVLASALIALRSVPNSTESSPHPFDYVGAASSIVATVGITYALHEGPVYGWTAPVTAASIAAAIAGLALFIWWELRTPGPLLDIRHFRTRGLSSGSMLLVVMFGVQAGVALMLFPFFQVVLGWGGLLSTLALMPMAGLMMLASGLAPHLALRIGRRVTMATGVFIAAAGLALMASIVSAQGGYLSVLPGLIVMGLGAGLAMTPSTESITSALPNNQQGVASAVNDLTREFGAALGIALLGALLTAGYRSAAEPALTDLPEPLAEHVRDGVANAAAASVGSGEYAQPMMDIASESFVSGWQQSMWVGAAVMAALFVFVALRGPRESSFVSAPDDADVADDAVVAGAPAQRATGSLSADDRQPPR